MTGKFRKWDLYRIGLLIAVIFHLLISLSVILQKRSVIWPLHNDTVHRKGKGADFFSVYHAGINHCAGKSPYLDLEDKKTPYYYPFRYLPFMIFFGDFLTAFKPFNAYLFWIVLNECILLTLLMIIPPLVRKKTVKWFSVYFMLLSSPYFLEMHMGQFTFASISLALLSLLLPAGAILLSLSILIKPVTLIILPLLLRFDKYRRQALITLMIVLVLTAPYFISNSQDWWRFFEVNFNLTGGMDSGNFGLLKLVNMAVKDFSMNTVDLYWEFFAGSFRILILALTLLLVVLRKEMDICPGVAVLLLAHFLTYQHVWEHHMSAVAVIGIYMLTSEKLSSSSRLWVMISVFFLVIPTPFYFFDLEKSPLIRDPQINWKRYMEYLLVLPKAIPVLVLYLVSLKEAIGERVRP